ncbi:MAG TPA: GNAT family N-acetyltransferase [Gammaproteobacteria bacterium]|nr:GNAT family N-acetyltransferase [Gammaproteobacteria bacterium]
MNVAIVESLDRVNAREWDGLLTQGYPFLRHAFLHALERHQGLGPGTGWHPRYLLMREGAKLVGALPLYLKDHSWGEFVFDWAWADACRRSGVRYYPKLIIAAPYTPATGPRLLTAPEPRRPALIQALAAAAMDYARDSGVSSLHGLFMTEEALQALEQHGALRRTGCQFHWYKGEDETFEDYLARFTSAKRKKIKRERRQVKEAGITTRVLTGEQVEDAHWRCFYRCYRDTFLRKSGFVPLPLAFFQTVGRTLSDAVVLALAEHRGKAVAAALSFRGDKVLYGRYWGSEACYHSLHFELCYYTGIEYCLRQGIHRFEPGAQGEHKVSRGFLPRATYSAHWLKDRHFHNAVAKFLRYEQREMDYYMKSLLSHSPFKTPRPL